MYGMLSAADNQGRKRPPLTTEVYVEEIMFLENAWSLLRGQVV